MKSKSNRTGHYLAPRKDVNDVISSHRGAKDERLLIWCVIFGLTSGIAVGALCAYVIYL